MHEFRRSRRLLVLTIIWSVFVLGVMVIAGEMCFKIVNVPSNILDKCIGAWVLYLVVCMVITATFPEDFEYYIEEKNNTLVFDFSEDDHRVITTPFWIASKTRKVIVISDGCSRIPLMYNKAVLRYLKKYQKPSVDYEVRTDTKEQVEDSK